jgi:hypothetical protein
LLYRGASQSWTKTAGAPVELVQATSRKGDAAAFIFGYPLRAGHPENPSNKILWVVRQPREGSDLLISSHSVAQLQPIVTVRETADSSPGEIYPSIVDVPSRGCWQFTLQWHGHTDAISLPYT